MTDLGPTDQWGSIMDGPRKVGGDLRLWLEHTPPLTETDLDLATRAVRAMIAEAQQVLDQLEVWWGQHLELRPRPSRRLGGGDAIDGDLVREEAMAEDSTISEAIEADYRASLQTRSPVFGAEREARSEAERRGKPDGAP